VKIVVAPNAFKGSLTAVEASNAIATGLARVFPEAELVLVPIADGGDGTMEALVAVAGGELRSHRVTGPLGEPVTGDFGLIHAGRTAIIEMAKVAGLALVPPGRRNPAVATTAGVGELLRHTLELGARDFVVGIGGSATNDAGAGMAQALGFRLRDAAGRDLPYGGAALAQLAAIDARGVDPRWKEVSVQVACDVTNPLTGPEGASAVYGPQKGATPAMVRELDAALVHFAEIVRRDLGMDVMSLPGGGAAGGLGAGLVAFLGARLRPGAEMVLELVGMRERLRGADLVVTGEGQIDAQTAFGKAPARVAELARDLGIPAVALAGSVGPGADALRDHGIVAVLPLPDGPLSLQDALASAAPLLTDAAQRAGRWLQVGKGLRGG
jgi:glycerate kinase